ncbi:hypothetical protein JCM10213_001351 [Rhodosporidiobolus nylandii]
MGRPALAGTVIFYGIPVRTRTLLLSAIAFHLIKGPLAFIRSFRLERNPSRPGAVHRVPPEIWEKIQANLLADALEQAWDKTAFPAGCTCLRRPGRKVWVSLRTRYGHALLGQEKDLARCPACKARRGVAGVWKDVFEDREIVDLINLFLRFYGLFLPSRQQYTHFRHGCAGKNSACFIGVDARIHPRFPQEGEQDGTVQIWCQEGHEKQVGPDKRPVPDKDNQCLLRVGRLPVDADERVALLRREFPQIEVLDLEDGLMTFAGAPEEDRGAKEGHVGPDWRVFVEAQKGYQ